jgi:glycosyltransferase involved in cell wall biosynthesis
VHIVHTEASQGWGGQEIRILGEAAGMMGRGHRVTLLCPGTAQIFAGAARYGVSAEVLPIGRKNFTGLIALRNWLKGHPVDVINTHSSTDSWLAALACASLPQAPPIVRTRHISTAVPNNLATRWLYRRATRHIVTTGTALREQLIRDNGIDGGMLTSVPTGIDLKAFAPGDRKAAREALGLPLDATIVGIVATLRDWKGHDYLIEAFARLQREENFPRLRLLMVGDGPQRPHIEGLIAARGLQQEVLMPGNQPQVARWLQAMDLFSLPSYANEGVPQALMQAMACALPVISTPVGSITEIIESERTGLLVLPKDVDALHGALVRLLADTALRQRLGAAAREEALRRFGDNIMLDRMEAVFRDAVLSERRK